MSWRTLMKAEIQHDHNSPGPKETSTKYTKLPDPGSEDPNQDNFVDIVDENRAPELSNPSATEPAEMVEPSSARLAFDLNSNLPDEGRAIGNQAIFFPSGRKVRFQSPMWDELEAEVLDDRGAVVWCWHPLRHCECCIPREWILGLAESLNEC
jgi:hypothetical protein